MTGYDYKTFGDVKYGRLLDDIKNWLNENFRDIEIISINTMDEDDYYKYKTIVWYKTK